MTFPGAGAQVYYNDAGEPIGWDYPSSEPEERDPYDDNGWWSEDEPDDEDDDVDPRETFSEQQVLDDEHLPAVEARYERHIGRT